MKKWIILVAVIVICAGAYVYWQLQKDQPKIETSNKSSTSENVANKQTSENDVHEYKSVSGVSIVLDNFPKDGVVKSPFTLTGKVPGTWSSEGKFPINLLYQKDISLPGDTAELQADWKTEDMVPFTATITMDNEHNDDLMMVIRNANPSGMPENDDSLGLKIKFE